jgi:hypothetical protein
MTVFELRQYRTHPGQRDNWVKYMEEVIIPFQTARGMTIIGSWVGEQEDDLYVWVRRFDSEEERQRLYRDVYESDEWKSNIAPKIPDMMNRERIVVTRLTPTPRSSMN